MHTHTYNIINLLLHNEVLSDISVSSRAGVTESTHIRTLNVHSGCKGRVMTRISLTNTSGGC